MSNSPNTQTSSSKSGRGEPRQQAQRPRKATAAQRASDANREQQLIVNAQRRQSGDMKPVATAAQRGEMSDATRSD